MTQVKQDVRRFYDQVGWSQVSEGVYQNAHYEDLRPVAQEYINRCHARVSRHLAPSGRLLLDAGSGPIQYPAYLEYSRGYQRRVCADISITALREARARIGEHGLFVVCDVANLPFKREAFDGVVSLHTIHHLPEQEHLQAYGELERVLAQGRSGVVVNGWPESRFVALFDPLIRLSNRVRGRLNRRAAVPGAAAQDDGAQAGKAQKRKQQAAQDNGGAGAPKGTFTQRHDVEWVRHEVGGCMPVAIYPWRSASVRLTRALIHPRLAGRALLRLLFWLEERFPGYFGANGQYPMIVVRKTSARKSEKKA